MEHRFDIHIEYRENCYDGDCYSECSVTFPQTGAQPPITVEYDDHDGDLSNQTILIQAAQDIVAYTLDPEAWEREYVAHSTETWRKLKEAEQELLYARQQ